MLSQSTDTVRARSVNGDDLLPGAAGEEVVHAGTLAGPSGSGLCDHVEDMSEVEQGSFEAVDEAEQWEDIPEEEEVQEEVKRGGKGKGRMRGERKRRMAGKEVTPVRTREKTPPTSPRSTSIPGSPVKVGLPKGKAVVRK